MPLIATIDGRRVRAAADGPRRAACVDCDAEMIAKTGRVVTHHWAHRHAADTGCGAGETEWHLSWKSRCADMSRVEVAQGQRRADVMTTHGWAVEFQHSPLPVAEVRARERDWGRRMVWVFDARDAAEGARLTAYRPPERTYHTITWAWSKSYVIAAGVPTFLHVAEDALFLMGRWYDKQPDRPIRGYGWRLGADAFAACVIDGARPPRPPLFGRPLDPRVWVAARAALDCPDCGGALGEQPTSRCAAGRYHQGVAA